MTVSEALKAGGIDHECTGDTVHVFMYDMYFYTDGNQCALEYALRSTMYHGVNKILSMLYEYGALAKLYQFSGDYLFEEGSPARLVSYDHGYYYLELGIKAREYALLEDIYDCL